MTVRYLVTRRRAGRTLYYWIPKKHYLVRGIWLKCPLGSTRLSDDPTEAFKEAGLLNQHLAEWRAGGQKKRHYVKGSFCWLIGEYERSSAFTTLGKRTRAEYGYILKAIRDELHKRHIQDAPAEAFTRQHARMLYAKFTDTPRKAQLVAAISRVVFNYGIDHGLVTENPFKEMRIKKTPPREQIWLDFENDNPYHRLEALKGKAVEMGVPSIAWAIDFALFTAQRENDILAFPWSKYTGKAIKLRQSKTNVWVEMPALPQLRLVLDAIPRTSPVILLSERTGKPYSKDHFGDVFREVRTAAKLPVDLQFRDLRRTAVVMLALAGCTIPEISAITGHTNAEVSEILETYMPRNTQMANNAMAKLESYLASGK